MESHTYLHIYINKTTQYSFISKYALTKIYCILFRLNILVYFMKVLHWCVSVLGWGRGVTREMDKAIQSCWSKHLLYSILNTLPYGSFCLIKKMITEYI